MARCKAFLDGGTRCNEGAVVVDARRGCVVCQAHRSGPQQVMACCQCARLIALGERWEYWSPLHRRKDGSDPVICGACLKTLLSQTVAALGAVPEQRRGG